MITFDERHANNPEAIHSWFYPGDNYGWETLAACLVFGTLVH